MPLLHESYGIYEATLPSYGVWKTKFKIIFYMCIKGKQCMREWTSTKNAKANGSNYKVFMHYNFSLVPTFIFFLRLKVIVEL